MAVNVNNGWLRTGDYYMCRLSDITYIYQLDAGTRIMLQQGDFHTAETYEDVGTAIVQASAS